MLDLDITEIASAIQKAAERGGLGLTISSDRRLVPPPPSVVPSDVSMLTPTHVFSYLLKKTLQEISESKQTLKSSDKEEDLDSNTLTFSLEGEDTSNVTINNPINTTINFNLRQQKEEPMSKMELIEVNLLTLANAGVQFDRKSTYHVRVKHNAVWWNFYLTSEKYHRDGMPSEAKGIENFIKMLGEN